jgi:hypothetical protein
MKFEIDDLVVYFPYDYIYPEVFNNLRIEELIILNYF